eukprot:13449617-Alexandrium_andersonii.AAC.1
MSKTTPLNCRRVCASRAPATCELSTRRRPRPAVEGQRNPQPRARLASEALKQSVGRSVAPTFCVPILNL